MYLFKRIALQAKCIEMGHVPQYMFKCIIHKIVKQQSPPQSACAPMDVPSP